MPPKAKTIQQLSVLLGRVLAHSAPEPNEDILRGKMEFVLGTGLRLAVSGADGQLKEVAGQDEEHRGYVLWGEGIEAVRELSAGLAHAVGDVHPTSAVEAVKHVVGQLRDEGVPHNDEGVLTEALANVAARLETAVADWTAAIPVKGLALCQEVPTLEVGGVTFRSWHHLDWPQAQEAHGLLKDQQGPLFPGKVPETTAETIAAAWQYLPIVGCVNIRGDQPAAAERARAKVEDALDLLQCVSTVVHGREPKPLLTIPDGPPWQLDSCALFNPADGKVGGGFTVRRGDVLTVDADKLVWLKKNIAFDRLDETLSAQSTQTRLRLKAAVRWLARGIRSTSEHERVLFANIALETLLCPAADRRIAEWLGQALSFLVGRNVQSRIELCAFVRRVYQARSQVAHTGQGKDKMLQEAELVRLEGLALTAIAVVAENHDRFPTDDDFCGWVNACLLSLPTIP